jgi:hypothetical protein
LIDSKRQLVVDSRQSAASYTYLEEEADVQIWPWVLLKIGTGFLESAPIGNPIRYVLNLNRLGRLIKSIDHHKSIYTTYDTLFSFQPY